MSSMPVHTSVLLRLVGLAGLSALLASCDITVRVPDQVVPNQGTQSTTLKLTKVTSFSSEYTLQRSAFDQNGNILPVGSSIICDNRDTRLEVDVAWSGDLQQIGVQFKGLSTGDVSTTRVFGTKYTAPDYSGQGFANIVVSPGMAPLKVSSGLSAQRITPTPITNVNVKGNTYVQAIALDSRGRQSNVVESVNAIPVADCF